MRLTRPITPFILSAALIATPAAAQEASDLKARVEALEALIRDQSGQIAAQRAVLDQQAEQLRLQKDALATLRDDTLATMRGAGVARMAAADATVDAAQARPLAPGPNPESTTVTVGEAPAPTEQVEVAAIPESAGVLTPRGQFVFDPAFRYVQGSTNRLVFRGVEIATGVQIGALEASDADQSTLSPSIALRYGVTNRLEVELVVPYLDRRDRITTVAQQNNAVTRTFELEGSGFGDVEAGLRYQLNRARPGRPVFIASARYKSDSGDSPYDIPRDAFGVATALATGSGFESYQAGLSFLYPTDPAVLFGGLSYLYNAPKDIDRMIGNVVVGRVNPGDSITANAGFGFALNPQFSFSLGYQHTYVARTSSILDGTKQKSQPLEVGSFMFGWSLRLSQRLTLNNSYELGATTDAPNVSMVLRLPYRF